MPANTKVGEMDLDLDGQSYVLRPSFEVSQAIEDATAKGCSELLHALYEGTPRVTDTVHILWIAAIRNNKRVPPFGKFGELLAREKGLGTAGRIASLFLSNCVTSVDEMAAIEAKVAEANEAEANDTKDSDPEVPQEAAEDPSPSE